MKSYNLYILGALLLCAPLLLFWWATDFDRYVSMINGPFPFSHMGGGPFQLAFYTVVFLLGLVCLGMGFITSRNER